jgi:hypothetical protein
VNCDKALDAPFASGCCLSAIVEWGLVVDSEESDGSLSVEYKRLLVVP